MKAEQLLARLRDMDVRVWVEGDRLRLSAARGVLTPELQHELSQSKGEIIASLRAADTALRVNAVPIRPVPRDGDLRLSFAQERMWFLEQLAPGSPVYNVPAGVRLHTPIDAVVLERSLGEIVRRHEALRTTFLNAGGEPRQKISPPEPLNLAVVDLRGYAEVERKAESLRLAAAEARQPFDLARGPLMRAVLIQLADDEHLLLVTMHHIVSDGWSIGVLLRELGAIYPAFLAGEPSPLPELPIQYADFADWQRQWLSDEVMEAHLTYWKEQLGGSLPVLDLPTDHPRPATQSYRGAVRPFALPADLLRSLTALSQREGATLFMTLLAAFNVLLHRYTGQEDVPVGTPVANRDRIEIEPLIGMFVNTLVMRTDLSGDPTFRDLLARVREVAIGAYAHQDVPFEFVVEALNPSRDMTRSPLFQVMFAYEKAVFSPLGIDTGTSRYDLTLFLWEEADRLTGVLEYSTDLFEKETIDRMFGHLQTLLEAVVADPQIRISEMQLLTQGESRLLLQEWRGGGSSHPPIPCMHELFEAQVSRTPGRAAATFKNQQITYRDLNRRANQLAHYLRRLGVVEDTLVGICVDRSIEMLVGVLGVLKAGGAYVPLDPAYPEDRLAYMIADSRMPILLTQQQLMARLPPHSARTVCLDSDWAEVDRESRDDPAPGASPDRLAYTIYTSGSTGRPKGVQITQRALANLLQSMRREPGLSDRDVLLAVTTLSFDIAALELLLPLIVGGRVVIADRATAADGPNLRDLLASSKATVMQATPVTWHMLIESGWKGDPDLKILCGGEALSSDLADQLLERCGSLWNLYGPTETTVWSTVCRVEPERRTITVGRPIDNTQVYILDPGQRPAPIGVPGNLHIAGAGLARGYLNQPELTAGKFVPNPFDPEPGARMYRTDDQARFLPDGSIEHLGRLDSQVKVRGYRIELEEIEVVLRQHPAVHQAVTSVRADKSGDKRLAAYVVNAPGHAAGAAELREFLRQRLPEYMIPSAFVFMQDLPLTPNRKIDRRALPDPSPADLGAGRGDVAPRSATESKLAHIWEEVLGVERVSVTDNFFDLGGHSLLAVRLFAAIEREFGQVLPLAMIFEQGTVECLARVIDRQTGPTPWPCLVPIQPRGSRPPLFFVHPFAGDVIGFKIWADYLGDAQPFYGLRARGLDGIQEPFDRFEDMAAQYIKELREVQPEGPYYLGGYCAGGPIAFEMAQQLQAAGQVVALVAVVNQAPPGSDYYKYTWGLRPLVGFLRNAPYWVKDSVKLSPHQIRYRLANSHPANLFRLGRAIARWLLKKALLNKSVAGPQRGEDGTEDETIGRPVYPEAFDANRRKYGDAFRRAWVRYVPRLYPGRITVFRTERQPLLCSFEPKLCWGPLAGGGVDVRVISGSNTTIVNDPDARVFAEQLRMCLDGS